MAIGTRDLASLARLVNKNSKEVLQIPINDIISKKQVRTEFKNLEELANSLKTEGQQQPITVTPANSLGQYTIIIGERRWRAAKMAGLDTVDALIRQKEQKHQDLVAGQLVENIQREDLSPLEIAASIGELINSGWRNKKIAERLGKSDTYVSLYASLIDLPDKILDLAKSKLLTDANSLSLLGKAYDLDKEKTLLYIQEIQEKTGGATRSQIRHFYNAIRKGEESSEEPKAQLETSTANEKLIQPEQTDTLPSAQGATSDTEESFDTSLVNVTQTTKPVSSSNVQSEKSDSAYVEKTSATPRKEQPVNSINSNIQDEFGALQIDPANLVITVLVASDENEDIGHIMMNVVSKNKDLVWVVIDGKPREVHVNTITIVEVVNKNHE